MKLDLRTVRYREGQRQAERQAVDERDLRRVPTEGQAVVDEVVAQVFRARLVVYISYELLHGLQFPFLFVERVVVFRVEAARDAHEAELPVREPNYPLPRRDGVDVVLRDGSGPKLFEA